MHRVTIIVVSLCVGYLSAEKPTVHIDPVKVGDIMQSFMQCLTETQLDPEMLLRLRNADYPETSDKNVQKFLYCASVKSGYGKKNGHMRVDKVMELYPKDANKDAIRKAMEECNSKDEKSPEETSYAFFKCFKEKSPVKTVLL